MDKKFPAADTVQVTITTAELDLIRNALENLESIMGHEEADTLERVQTLLKKLGG